MIFIFNYIKENELADLIKSDYPNLIHTLNVTHFVQLMELSEARSFEEAKGFYAKINDTTKPSEPSKQLKNKI